MRDGGWTETGGGRDRAGEGAGRVNFNLTNYVRIIYLLVITLNKYFLNC